MSVKKLNVYQNVHINGRFKYYYNKTINMNKTIQYQDSNSNFWDENCHTLIKQNETYFKRPINITINNNTLKRTDLSVYPFDPQQW